MEKLLKALVAIGVLVGTRYTANGQDSGKWLQRLPETHPRPEFSCPMQFDQTGARSFVYFGGINEGEKETWSWDGVRWILVSAGAGPQLIDRHGMAIDGLRGVPVVFGGQEWIPGQGYAYVHDTWEWRDDQWVFMETHGRPAARLGHSMVYDTVRAVVLLFGGIGGDDNNIVQYGDTWSWNGKSWTKVAETGPSPRSQHAMTFDEHRGVAVLFGGGADGATLWDTWEWDGVQWTLRDAMAPFGGRTSGGMVYDSKDQVCLFFGGNTAADGPANDLWAWDGKSWQEIITGERPIERREFAMSYDSTRDAVVLFGGLDRYDNVYDDTWEFICEPSCYPDFDLDGDLTLFDFLAFVNAFNAGGDQPDCDENGLLDLFDFLCFVNAFNAGC